MKRKRLLKVLGATGVLLLGAAGCALWLLPAPITQASCDRIQKGMSRARVHAILGPPGDYRTRECYALEPPAMPVVWETWQSNRGCIWVGYDPSSGLVSMTDYMETWWELPFDMAWLADHLRERFAK